MSFPPKATAEEVVAAYQETGSVWRAGKALGMAGQSVHERLVAIGYPLAGRHWTTDEDEEMRVLIANGVPLGEVAHRLGRPYGGVAGRASLLGFRSEFKRRRKLPRGGGYDKVSTGRHLKALERSSSKPTQYARAQALNIDLLVHAFQVHFPDQWAAYLRTHSPLPTKVCPYCETEFIPTSGKQTHCTRKCSGDARRDAAYFGGKRRDTIGLAEGVCQLCGRSNAKGLSAHHALGKANDPENRVLIALCRGCHQMVSHLGGRAFVDDPRAWEALISLAWARRHGEDIAASDSMVVEVVVSIEARPMDEDEIEEARRIS